jgi:hypothetical protein
MGRENIYKTLSVGAVVSKNNLTDLVDFFIDSRAYVLPSVKKSEAFKTRFSGNSILSDIVHRLTVLGNDKTFSLIKLPTKTIALREVVDMSFIPFDILQMKELITAPVKSLSLLPELDDKLVINITDITKANGDFSDISQFQYRVVRDFLSRSFYMSSGSVWVSPTFVRYIAKVYNMTIGGQIARLFDLSPPVQMFVQSVFCLFFVGKMTSLETAQSFTKSHSKNMGLYNAAELPQIFAFIEDVLGKPAPDNLVDVCRVIDAYGHDQLSGNDGARLTLPVLSTRFGALFNDSHVSRISLEYPPYFAFLIILVLSNVRIGLSFPMKNFNLVKEGQEIFGQAVRSSLFLNSL